MALNQAGLMTLQGAGFALAGAAAEWIGTGRAIAVAGCCGLAATMFLALFGRKTATAVRDSSNPVAG